MIFGDVGRIGNGSCMKLYTYIYIYMYTPFGKLT